MRETERTYSDTIMRCGHMRMLWRHVRMTQPKQLKMRSVSRICAHLSIVYVTHTIDERAHMRETERTFSKRLALIGLYF